MLQLPWYVFGIKVCCYSVKLDLNYETEALDKRPGHDQGWRARCSFYNYICKPFSKKLFQL